MQTCVTMVRSESIPRQALPHVFDMFYRLMSAPDSRPTVRSIGIDQFIIRNGDYSIQVSNSPLDSTYVFSVPVERDEDCAAIEQQLSRAVRALEQRMLRPLKMRLAAQRMLAIGISGLLAFMIADGRWVAAFGIGTGVAIGYLLVRARQ